jgi:hypothetical protein
MKMPLDEGHKNMVIEKLENAISYTRKNDVPMALYMVGEATLELGLAISWGRRNDNAN